MRSSILVGFVAVLLFPSFVFANQDAEYRQMLKRLNERYEGFFIYQQELKRSEARRLSGISAVKDRRKAERSKKEKVRKAFRRAKKVDKEPLRLAWEKKERQIEMKKEVARKAFVKKQKAVAKVRASARKVPERKDVGLDEL